VATDVRIHLPDEEEEEGKSGYIDGENGVAQHQTPREKEELLARHCLRRTNRHTLINS
jgi:hypothetical protein